MQALLSPQSSSSIRPELFTKCRSPSLRNQRSPSCRNKRIPSLQEHLCHSNHVLRSSKQESPSKGSEEVKRKKSQFNENHQLNSSNTKRRQGGNGSASTQNIMNSIQDLKEQYQILKQAYKELIQQKMKNQQQMIRTKLQNQSLKGKLQSQARREQKYQAEVAELRQGLARANLEAEDLRRRNKDLLNDLYFIRETQKSNTDNLVHSSAAFQFEPFASDRFKQDREGDRFKQDREGDRFRQEREGVQGEDRVGEVESNIANESHLLSFSLTSVIDDSIKLEQFSCRRKEHVKVVSELSQATALNEQFRNIDVKPKKGSFTAFKKQKKDTKLDFVNESKAIAPSPLSQLLNLKSPVSSEKKAVKAMGNSSTSKRRKEDKENVDLGKNSKKKSKKLLQIGGGEE